MTRTPPPIPRLHVITDTVVQNRYDAVELARLALAGGARLVQVRDKRLDDDAFAGVVREVVALCRSAGALCIVNDRVEVARATHAHGVHVGADDAPVAAARAALGPGAIVGASASTPEAARAAEAAGADYVGCGAVWATASKHKSEPPIGLEGLRAVCEAVRIPVIAIGGVTAERARACIEAGAHGVAVIGAVCAAPDPRAATEALVRVVDSPLDRAGS